MFVKFGKINGLHSRIICSEDTIFENFFRILKKIASRPFDFQFAKKYVLEAKKRCKLQYIQVIMTRAEEFP